MNKNINLNKVRNNFYQNGSYYDLYNNRQTLVLNLGVKVQKTSSVNLVKNSLGVSGNQVMGLTTSSTNKITNNTSNNGVYIIDLVTPLVIDHPSIIELESIALYSKDTGITDKLLIIDVDKFNIKNCTNDPNLQNKIVVGNTLYNNILVPPGGNFITDNGNLRYSHVATINPGKYSQLTVTVHGYNSITDGPPKKLADIDETAPNTLAFVIIEQPVSVIVPPSSNYLGEKAEEGMCDNPFERSRQMLPGPKPNDRSHGPANYGGFGR